MWGAVIAFTRLGERLTAWRVLGLAIGFAGVVILAWSPALLAEGGSGLAIAAVLGATLSYGFGPSYTRRRLADVDPLVVATGSQIGAAIVLAPLALATWPASPVSSTGWVCVVLMGVASTGIAYVLYFRLISNLGAARAIAVTFLIPVFAVGWGWLFLDETLTLRIALGGLVVLAGTALATGMLPLGRAHAEPSRNSARVRSRPPGRTARDAGAAYDRRVALTRAGPPRAWQRAATIARP